MTEDEVTAAVNAACEDARRYVRECLIARGIEGTPGQVYATIMLMAVSATACMTQASDDPDTIEQFAYGIRICRRVIRDRQGATLQ